MSRIERIDISQHQLALDPPFPAAWDSRARTRFPATVVRVTDDEGRVGVGAGDPLYGFADFCHLFIGRDPLDLGRHAAIIDNISFHAGRCWPLDAALWDLAGKIRGQPVWRMAGGRANRVRAYASSGTHRSPMATAALAVQIRDAGFPALKLRFGRPDPADDLAALAMVREAVGMDLDLMVDCNQGWRMPWDDQSPWHLERALAVAGELERFDVLWMEEPLHRGDYAGMVALRKCTHLLIAGGEMTRERYEFTTLLERGCLDVFQPDAVCTVGIGGLMELAVQVVNAGARFSPHTWGNGLGLMANLQVAAGAVSPEQATFLEYPFDPPEWTPERRDFLLEAPIKPDAQGWLVLPDAAGLGVALDEAMLARTRSGGATYF